MLGERQHVLRALRRQRIGMHDIGVQPLRAGLDAVEQRVGKLEDSAPFTVEIMALRARLTAGQEAGLSGDIDALEARLTSAERAATAPIPVGGTPFRRLLVRWSQAQSAVASNINILGQAILAHPEVQADPRFAQVRDAVSGLRQLVPDFGNDLRSAIDVLINAGSAATPEQQRAARDTARTYAASLRNYPALTDLEELARMVGAGNLSFGTALQQTLEELQGELSGVR